MYFHFHRERGLLTKVMRLNLLGSDKPTWKWPAEWQAPPRKILLATENWSSLELWRDKKFYSSCNQDLIILSKIRFCHCLTGRFIYLYMLAFLTGSLALLLKRNTSKLQASQNAQADLVNILLCNWPPELAPYAPPTPPNIWYCLYSKGFPSSPR